MYFRRRVGSFAFTLGSVGGVPNDMQISCRRSSHRPHKSTLPLLGLEEGATLAEPRPTPACRLHLRVRPHATRNPAAPAQSTHGTG